MATSLFALVEWKDDPKPDCWQVIRTSQIQAHPDDICEGKNVDALWKKDEETSVAEILKLGGESILSLAVSQIQSTHLTCGYNHYQVTC